MTVRRFIGAVLLVSMVVPFGISQSHPVDSDVVQRKVSQGVIALQQGRYTEAQEHFQQAEKLAGTASAEINVGMALSELQLGHFHNARQREARVLETVLTDHARAEAHNVIGMSWLRESAESAASAEMLRSAEDSFRQALRLDPWFDSAHFNLGETLVRENRNAEAAQSFKKFIEAAAKDPAQEDGFPLRPQRRAPEYKVTDTEGRVFSPDAMRGRFVLLDFWATWCPPCIRALRVMRELAHYFPAERLRIISINEDSPEDAVWRLFITERKMDWVQVWDKDSAVYSSFALAPSSELSLPRYVFLDRDNSVLHVYSGTDRLGFVVGQIVKTVETAATDTVRTP